MPYTNGIFHIDYVSGSDAARTALTGCVASNPSGTITRINKTGHGLTTGAVVDTTLFTPWLNGAWKVTVVDADNFDLDGAVWQATADPNGTVTPRGGSSWSDAWATVTSGATAVRIQPGDEIRIAQTEEVSTGVNATFTNESRTVTLDSPLTKNIELATTQGNWTVSANITRSVSTTRKIGSNSVVFTPASGFTTGKVAYAPIAGGGTQDFSAYSKISLYFMPSSANVIAADTYKICLCSDAIGDTIVNEINIPVTQNIATLHSFVLDYGASLGNNIQSVAIYANVDPGTVQIVVNNIFACNDFHLQSVFGPDNDCVYSVQAIDGVTVTIDSANNAAAGRGWSGITGSYTVHRIQPIMFLANTGTGITIQEAGTASNITRYIGGWDKTSGLQVGRTFFKNIVNGGATGCTMANYTSLEHAGLLSFNNSFSTTIGLIQLDDVVTSSCASSLQLISGIFKNCLFTNCANNGVAFGTSTQSTPCVFYNCVISNNGSSGINLINNTKFVKCILRNNASSSVAQNGPSLLIDGTGGRFYSCTFLDATEFTYISNAFGNTWSYRHDDSNDNHWGFTNGGTINWQTTEKQGSDPGSWRVVHNSTARVANQPISFMFAEIAVEASALVTVKAWVKKDHATNVGCRIKVEGADFTLPGISETITTALDNTNWQELTLTFTPSAAGVVPIIFQSFYIAGNSNTYLGSITVTQ
jgi:hypothetical protein